MKINMGMLDRGFRVGLAILAGLFYWTGALEGLIGILAICFAGIFLLTSLVGFCPLYLPFGFNTKKEN